ncbi:hypothetical protein TIFTF001_015542 [Ficus carica]|uniref:Uncharacterized protein n=1 Tax=Ficus carica TaxID=3494 RepID=A0AA88D6M3_FICCA|nr:hypothetical protein TIFTF001_015542 [Ficus carica]
MEEECLDFVLIPMGLFLFGTYHAWLFFTIRRHPRRTVIGLNAESRHQWVFSMMAVVREIESALEVRCFSVGARLLGRPTDL